MAQMAPKMHQNQSKTMTDVLIDFEALLEPPPPGPPPKGEGVEED